MLKSIESSLLFSLTSRSRPFRNVQKRRSESVIVVGPNNRQNRYHSGEVRKVNGKALANFILIALREYVDSRRAMWHDIPWKRTNLLFRVGDLRRISRKPIRYSLDPKLELSDIGRQIR